MRSFARYFIKNYDSATHDSAECTALVGDIECCVCFSGIRVAVVIANGTVSC